MKENLGWDIIEETDVTDKYKFWCNAVINKIKHSADMIKASGYTEEEISLYIEN